MSLEFLNFKASFPSSVAPGVIVSVQFGALTVPVVMFLKTFHMSLTETL